MTDVLVVMQYRWQLNLNLKNLMMIPLKRLTKKIQSVPQGDDYKL